MYNCLKISLENAQACMIANNHITVYSLKICAITWFFNIKIWKKRIFVFVVFVARAARKFCCLQIRLSGKSTIWSYFTNRLFKIPSKNPDKVDLETINLSTQKATTARSVDHNRYPTDRTAGKILERFYQNSFR